MSIKKKDKRLAHATMVWEREQLQAATAMEQLNKALAVILHNKEELSDAELVQVQLQVETRRNEVKAFLMNARDKYALKLHELGVEAVLPDNSVTSLVNLEDLVAPNA